MQILKYLQLPFCFDVPMLREEVKHLANENWQLHYQTMHYQGEWSAIPLRSTGGKADNIIISPADDIPYENTVFLNNCPYIQKLLQTFECRLQAVRLLKLNAGAVIKEHRDADLCFEKGEVRLHIPVITNEEVEFYLDKERIHLKEGECWYMNFNLPHSIINNGTTERIHLVVDAIVNDWVKQLFSQPALNRKTMEEPGYDIHTKRMMIERLKEMSTETSIRLAGEIEASLHLIPVPGEGEAGR
jgi:hypothetical protein